LESNPEFLTKHIHKDSLVLEAGCGYGFWCIYLNNQGYPCVGVDIVKEPLRQLQTYLRKHTSLNTCAIASDVTRLPFHAESFDLVLSFGVIEHFRNTDVVTALNEASRVLRKGGVLILIVPNLAFSLRNKLLIGLSKGRLGLFHKPYTRLMLIKLFQLLDGMRVVESGFTSFGLRGSTLKISNIFSPRKIMLFIYHLAWRIGSGFSRTITGEDYRKPIYIVAKNSDWSVEQT